MAEPSSAAIAWLDIALDQAFNCLARNTGLEPSALSWLRKSAPRVEIFPKGAMLSSTGATRQLKLVVAGWAAETRVLADSRRQICALHLPGDVVTPRLSAPHGLYGVAALTKLECLDLTPALDAAERPEKASVRRALTAALTINEARRYEHIVRLGQHTAPERLIHLLFELRERLAPFGGGSPDSFRLPLTQEDLADALGLSVVHINRTLRQLRAARMLEIRFGTVTLLQPRQLQEIIAATRVS